jgi:hypothetical protein
VLKRAGQTNSLKEDLNFCVSLYLKFKDENDKRFNEILLEKHGNVSFKNHVLLIFFKCKSHNDPLEMLDNHANPLTKFENLKKHRRMDLQLTIPQFNQLASNQLKKRQKVHRNSHVDSLTQWSGNTVICTNNSINTTELRQFPNHYSFSNRRM